jgi:arylsulfatase A-like enzyme
MRIAEHLTFEDLKAEPPAHLSGDELALWKYQRYMEDYLACVASVDDNVGRVVDHLRSRDVFDDTIVTYASDQGFFLGDHGWFDKRFVYEQSIHMPFVMSYPRCIPQRRVVPHMATNVDIAQTLLEACGVDAHSRMHGRSFWSLATGASDEPIHDAMYYRYFEHDDANHHVLAHCGVRTTTHKLVYFYNDGLGLPGTGPYRPEPSWELYDLVADPDELVNRYDDPACGEIVETLTARLAELQAELGDTPP